MLMSAAVAIHITIAALKGGVGKSTTTLNLATCLHRDGYRVLIVDADRQGTCRSWAAVAGNAGHPGPPVVAVAGAALRRDLPGLGQGYDVVVIDSPPYAGPEARSAMLVADAILIPTTPGAADAWALQDTLDVLAEVRALRPEIRASVLLNRADRTRLTKAVREAAAGLGLPLLPAELTVRVTYGEATLAGQGVVTYAPTSPAAKEVEKMTAAVLAVLRGDHEQAAATDGQLHATPAATPAPAATHAGSGGRGARTRATRRASPGPGSADAQLALPTAGPDSSRPAAAPSADAGRTGSPATTTSSGAGAGAPASVDGGSESAPVESGERPAAGRAARASGARERPAAKRKGGRRTGR